ncbi:organomercurial lyase [Staphylococcus lutrae]|uniref:Alkylmercury lyase n=1 Tax=Staphylococcus lutrae TaxID=155085 RepID=A0AAC9RQ94_9STAP|nr:organomercurial lyase [Staphylococcus lutrae]ARJ51771.1 hypothetical protein B5P37_10815 [Staphylococcus lutrae]PNZ35816.1 alkylmercury lyase [Staphylococcus lutrae]
MNFQSNLTVEERELRSRLMDKLITQTNQPVPFESEYQCLLDKNVIVLENNQVISVYPISAIPTNKKVYVKGRQQPIFAMCAIDAIGIHYTLDCPISIESEDELTGVPLHLEVNHHQVINRTNHDIYVLYKEVCTLEKCHENCCPYIHFFVSQDNIVQYLKNNKECQTYQILNLDEANQIAYQLFH